MQEDFLYYLWQFQQFRKTRLQTTTDGKLQIVSVGTLNEGAGPDFLHAHIVLDGIDFHGHVEIHVKSRNWYQHRHMTNPAYENVILHIVWEDDKPVSRNTGEKLPTLELQNYVPKRLLSRYMDLNKDRTPIICSTQVSRVPDLVWKGMLNRTLLNRITQKSHLAQKLLLEHKEDSDRVAYSLLASSFGFKHNSVPFLRLSELVPWSLIQKKAFNSATLEALFLGQGGLLEPAVSQFDDTKDDYLKDMQIIHNLLKIKYKLPDSSLKLSDWKISGVRPANSPFIRIAQFVQLIRRHNSLFSFFINSSVKNLLAELQILQSPYWQSHYQFGKSSKKKIPGLGKSSIYSIIINSVIPMLVTYGRLRQDDYYLNRAIKILRTLSPETNRVTKIWTKLKRPIRSAFESQAYLELFNSFCQPKKCLRCDVGKYLLNPKRTQP